MSEFAVGDLAQYWPVEEVHTDYEARRGEVVEILSIGLDVKVKFTPPVRIGRKHAFTNSLNLRALEVDEP